MILLTNTTETIEVTTSTANSTDYVCGWADHTTTTFVPGSGQGTIAAATTTAIVAAPAASTQRQVKYIAITNNGATNQQVIVKKDVSATEYVLIKVTLATGETLQYVDTNGWNSLDVSGAIKGAGSPGADGVDGAGTVLGTGTSEIDFGAGASDVTLTVTGQASITAGSLVYCWIQPTATTDHSADEHMLETIKVFAKDIVAGTGFTIHAFNTNQILEQSRQIESQRTRYSGAGVATLRGQFPRNSTNYKNEGSAPVITGKWTVGWLYTQ